MSKILRKSASTYTLKLGFLRIMWARRGSIWNFQGPAWTKYRWRQDHLISLVRQYGRGTGVYIYAFHLGPLRIDYVCKPIEEKQSREYRP